MKGSRNIINLFLGFVFILGTSIFSRCSDDGGGGSANVAVTGVTLDKTAISVLVGSTEQLTAAIEPAEATNQNVTWESIDDSVASVSETGLVTAAAGGATTITATTEDGHYTAACTVTADWTLGNKVTFSTDSVSFVMAYVAAAIFPVGVDDNGDIMDNGTKDVESPATVPYAYWIGETEVTYEVWNKVHTWATANEYYFDNTGVLGSSGSGSVKQPVTTINWRDAMVWCNAATEWFDEKKGTDYTCVYTYSGTIIRDSRNDLWCNIATAEVSATGFRLLTSDEWELAARWRKDTTNTVIGYSNPYFTQGDSASGATADYTNSAATQAVAWYYANSIGTGTHEVKGLSANALGLYDMSGNVSEWCFDWHPNYVGSDRVFRGGAWSWDGNYLQVGVVYGDPPNYEAESIGFRIARSK